MGRRIMGPRRRMMDGPTICRIIHRLSCIFPGPSVHCIPPSAYHINLDVTILHVTAIDMLTWTSCFLCHLRVTWNSISNKCYVIFIFCSIFYRFYFSKRQGRSATCFECKSEPKNYVTSLCTSLTGGTSWPNRVRLDQGTSWPRNELTRNQRDNGSVNRRTAERMVWEE